MSGSDELPPRLFCVECAYSSCPHMGFPPIEKHVEQNRLLHCLVCVCVCMRAREHVCVRLYVCLCARVCAWVFMCACLCLCVLACVSSSFFCSCSCLWHLLLCVHWMSNSTPLFKLEEKKQTSVLRNQKQIQYSSKDMQQLKNKTYTVKSILKRWVQL